MASKNNGLVGKARDEFMEEWDKTTKQLRESGRDLSKINLVPCYKEYRHMFNEKEK